MDETLKTMVELNVSGRVLLLCNSLGIRDQAEIQDIKKRVTQEILRCGFLIHLSLVSQFFHDNGCRLRCLPGSTFHGADDDLYLSHGN